MIGRQAIPRHGNLDCQVGPWSGSGECHGTSCGPIATDVGGMVLRFVPVVQTDRAHRGDESARQRYEAMTTGLVTCWNRLEPRPIALTVRSIQMP